MGGTPEQDEHYLAQRRRRSVKRAGTFTPSLFDPVDVIQQEGHAPWPAPRPADAEEPPVTPEPTPEERRDQGIKAAVDHADAVQPVPKWSVQAEAYAEMMIKRRGFKPFLFEEIVEAAGRDGVPKPPDGRAWGSIIRALAKRGVVRNIGYGKAKTSNLSPKVLWCKAVQTRA